MRTTNPSTARVRLRTTQLRQRAALCGADKDSEIAEIIGVHRSTISRLADEDRPDTPTGFFIAAALMAFPGCHFEDLFEVVDEPARRAA